MAEQNPKKCKKPNDTTPNKTRCVSKDTPTNTDIPYANQRPSDMEEPTDGEPSSTDDDEMDEDEGAKTPTAEQTEFSQVSMISRSRSLNFEVKHCYSQLEVPARLQGKALVNHRRRE